MVNLFLEHLLLIRLPSTTVFSISVIERQSCTILVRNAQHELPLSKTMSLFSPSW